jgi:hypothetical protein
VAQGTSRASSSRPCLGASSLVRILWRYFAKNIKTNQTAILRLVVNGYTQGLLDQRRRRMGLADVKTLMSIKQRVFSATRISRALVLRALGNSHSGDAGYGALSVKLSREGDHYLLPLLHPAAGHDRRPIHSPPGHPAFGADLPPIANMLQAVQYRTYLNHLRYFIVVMRGVFL